jgi:branched-chain amino acid transport system substrate-binding protein
MNTRLSPVVAVSVLVLGLAAPALAQSSAPVKIAVIEDVTGPLQAYAQQMENGFKLGLDYATKGTDQVAGRKIEVIYKDSQTKPDIGRSLLAEAYGDDHVDLAVGGTSSAVALAMLPVAEQYKKIFIVEPAVADSITGDKWNRYIFRTGRNSSQDAISNAIAIGGPDTAVATLAQDYAFGRDGVAAFKKALAPTGAKVVYEEYAPAATTDFTAPLQRVIDALKQATAKRRILWVIWAGVGNPFPALKAADLGRFGITLSTGGNILPALVFYKAFPGLVGATYYYYDDAHNPVNDWLVAQHEKLYKSPPDFFTCGGFAAAMAVVTALENDKGATDTETLIKTMEGMKFQTPKGEMIFRKEDHQALQQMYAFKIKVDPNVKWAIPELTRVIKISDMDVPIENGAATKMAQAPAPAAATPAKPAAASATMPAKPPAAAVPPKPAPAAAPPPAPTPPIFPLWIIAVALAVILAVAGLIFGRRKG